MADARARKEIFTVDDDETPVASTSATASTTSREIITVDDDETQVASTSAAATREETDSITVDDDGNAQSFRRKGTRTSKIALGLVARLT